MDQEKIGRFIAELRKENSLTQKELAEKLSVSDRTVGNWERGRNLPDPSLFVPLCSILGITLTELFNGERIETEHIIEKTDEVLTNAIEENKMYSVILIISSIIMSISIVIFFIPVLMALDKTPSIIIISIGLFLLMLGWSLKLTNYINWPGIWVFSPLWIGIGLIILFFMVILIIGRIKKENGGSFYVTIIMTVILSIKCIWNRLIVCYLRSFIDI